MTPTRGLKRFGIGLAMIVGAFIGAFVAIPFLLGPEAVRDAVQAEIRRATGLDPVLRGDITVHSFPAGLVTFADIALSADSSGRADLLAERLVAQLRFFPLLVGRVEVAEITLLRPHVVVDLDESGNSNWTGLISTLSEAVKPGSGSERSLSFSEIRLVGGTVRVQNRARGTAEMLDAVEVSLAWPSISKSFGATGQFVWRGEKIEASVTLGDFVAALNGERTGIKLRLNGKPIKLAFDGYLANKPALKLEGTLAADSPSLRQALEWAGHQPPPGGGFGRFALKAQTNILGDTVALSNVNVELDGNVAEGVLTLAGEERPVLQGTLAAEEIDVSPYVSTIRLMGANERDWSRLPITLEGLATMDVDLRVSASRVSFPHATVGRTAVAASLRGGRLALTIGESQAFGGVLKGSIGLGRGERGAEVKAQLQFTDVDLESSVNLVFGVRKLEGRGNMALSLEAAGSDVLALARSVSGSGTLVASRGALTGLNVEQLLRRLERRPLSGGGDFRNGRTPFEKLAVSLKISEGTAKVEDVKLEGSAVRVALGGSASIPSRELDLQGVAGLVGSNAKENVAFELPFVVRGRWDDPTMLPDIQTLIRRSGPAAPLLDAVRGGRARETARGIVEQLTRGTEPPQAVNPPPAEAAAAARPQ